jgi:hypothetical protein
VSDAPSCDHDVDVVGPVVVVDDGAVDVVVEDECDWCRSSR